MTGRDLVIDIGSLPEEDDRILLKWIYKTRYLFLTNLTNRVTFISGDNMFLTRSLVIVVVVVSLYVSESRVRYG